MYHRWFLSRVRDSRLRERGREGEREREREKKKERGINRRLRRVMIMMPFFCSCRNNK